MPKPTDRELARKFTELITLWVVELEEAEDLDGLYKIAAQLEATMRACVAFDKLKALDLGEPGYDISISQSKDMLESEPANRMTLDQFRAVMVGKFYAYGLLSPVHGGKDEPKHHARLLTANYEMEVREGRCLIDIEILDRKAQTIDRTQRRFKKSLEGKQVLCVDWDVQTVDVMDANEAYFQYHPSKPGRPRDPS